jgi:hypothetical protein
VRFRMFFGVLMVFFALGMTLLLAVAGAPLPARAAIFVPLWIGILCLLQAHRGICVFLAARGVCSVEGGNAVIEDAAVRRSLERRAVRIHLVSMSAASLLTIVLMMASLFIPWRSFFAVG